uniref:Osteoclast-stimulating factor 1 n=1 Tax=Astatotilapia calliptera TaxID=8154 RepID=A0AAX7TKH0_ASTCA
MNSAEQTVTWLITLGVLESPKKTISDPEAFLQTSLKDGVVLCRLLERLSPGSTEKVYQEPKNDGECLSNIKEFLKGCTAFRVEPFEASDLLLGLNFSKVLSSLVTLNKVTAGQLKMCSVCVCESVIMDDMSENSGQQLLVKARFNFQQTNEDELTFAKGDFISVTRQEEGGWWEGMLNGKTGWFPSNYVRESGTLKSPPKGFDTSAISKTYYNLVLQNILETETEYSKDLQSLLMNYLRPLQNIEKLSSSDVALILGNLEEISTFQQMLVQSLEECTKLPESQQRVGSFFLKHMPQMKALYVGYCSNHPSAVNVLTQYSDVLGDFMEGRGAVSPGILTLTTGLSKPFMRLDKYPTLLKELERHMEENHPDRPDIQKCMSSFKSLSAQCQEVRKRKELELQILTESIRLWEGDDIKTLGSVIYMSQVLVQSQLSEEKNERYLMLFPHILLMLSASPRMSGFIFQGKLPLAGMTVTKLEDCEAHRNAFELNGTMFDRLLVICTNQQDLQDWVEHLTRQIKHTANRALTVAPTYHTLPHPSSHGTPHNTMMWGPLEPPNTPKPWSLSCLRPAPPLRPSAALCYKEVNLIYVDLSKSPKSVKKLLPKRKPERKQSEEEFALRKSTAALEEDAQILKVIEAYCTSAKTRQTLNSSKKKTNSYPSRYTNERREVHTGSCSLCSSCICILSLVDVVYALRDEVQELKQDNKKMKRSLEEEQRARKDLEKVVRNVLKTCRKKELVQYLWT